MQEFLRPALGVAVFTLMLGVGLDCTADGFRRSASRPGLIAAVTVIQYLCIPALMLAVISLLGLKPAVATALLLIGACPSGAISNAFTFLAHGSTSLSVALTTVSNVVAFVATPLALAAVGRIAGGEIAETLTFPPGPLLMQLVVSMVLPLALGYVVRWKFPDFVLRNLKFVRILCVFLILSTVGLTILANPPEIGRQLKSLAFPVLLITPLLFALAWMVARVFRIGTGDRRAVLFELPCRNVALAMLIALSVLERLDLAFAAMAFFMLETVLILGIAGLLNRFSGVGFAAQEDS
jgi:BASS family bile acid:Na+ symporter